MRNRIQVQDTSRTGWVLMSRLTSQKQIKRSGMQQLLVIKEYATKTEVNTGDHTKLHSIQAAGKGLFERITFFVKFRYLVQI